MRSAKISSQFVSGVGLSNGCEELALKKPPPLLPSSLIHSCDATGPMAIVCCAPWRVVTVCDGSQVWGTPCHTRTSAPTIEIGSRMYRTPRVRSTQ